MLHTRSMLATGAQTFIAKIDAERSMKTKQQVTSKNTKMTKLEIRSKTKTRNSKTIGQEQKFK